VRRLLALPTLALAVAGFALAGCGNQGGHSKTGPVTVNETGEQIVSTTVETGTSTTG